MASGRKHWIYKLCGSSSYTKISFGYGLSYTKFAYTNLQIEKEEISAEESIQISVDVENVGSCAGDEVVQLYLRDMYASMVRPVKELAGFKRVNLQAGEKKHVVFEVAASQMAFLDINMRWKIEKGTIEVEVGSSSEDIRLTGAYRVTNDAWVQSRERGFYAKVSVNDVR